MHNWPHRRFVRPIAVRTPLAVAAAVPTAFGRDYGADVSHDQGAGGIGSGRGTDVAPPASPEGTSPPRPGVGHTRYDSLSALVIPEPAGLSALAGGLALWRPPRRRSRQTRSC